MTGRNRTVPARREPRTEAPLNTDRLDGPLLRLVVVLGVGGVMSYFDATIVNVSVHTLQERLDVSLTTISWVATGYLLAVAVAVPMAGWSLARFGARRLWLTGLTLFLAGSALAALSWNSGSLITFRVLQGLGAGILEPTMLTMLATAAGPRRTGRVMGLMTVPMTLGPVLGPVIGGVILQNLSWQWIFLINVPVALVAIGLAIAALPTDKPSRGQVPPFDVVGVLLLPPGFAAVVYALSQAGATGFGNPHVIVALFLGSMLLIGYVGHALGSPHPLIDLTMFRSKGFAASLTTMFLLGGWLFALLFLLPLYYQQIRGHGVLLAALMVMPLGIGLFATPIAGKLSDRYGPRVLVAAGALVVGAGAVVYAGATPDTPQLLLTAVLVVVGTGMSLVGPPTMGSLYRTVPPDAAGSATGAVFIFNQLGASLGIAAVALLLQRDTASSAPTAAAFGTAFWWIVVGAIPVLLATIFMPGRPPRPSRAPSPQSP